MESLDTVLRAAWEGDPAAKNPRIGPAPRFWSFWVRLFYYTGFAYDSELPEPVLVETSGIIINKILDGNN